MLTPKFKIGDFIYPKPFEPNEVHFADKELLGIIIGFDKKKDWMDIAARNYYLIKWIRTSEINKDSFGADEPYSLHYVDSVDDHMRLYEGKSD